MFVKLQVTAEFFTCSSMQNEANERLALVTGLVIAAGTLYRCIGIGLANKQPTRHRQGLKLRI